MLVRSRDQNASSNKKKHEPGYQLAVMWGDEEVAASGQDPKKTHGSHSISINRGNIYYLTILFSYRFSITTIKIIIATQQKYGIVNP